MDRLTGSATYIESIRRGSGYRQHEAARLPLIIHMQQERTTLANIEDRIDVHELCVTPTHGEARL